jgi:4-hydroxymandelate oxidase
MTNNEFFRRKALATLASVIAAPRRTVAQSRLPAEAPDRTPPIAELVDALEFEPVAERNLAPEAYSLIAGGDRSFFERITFRPRMMVNTTALDLTQKLFGQEMFTPILVGPTSRQQRFHPEGELATVRGASAAKVTMVVSGDSSVPIEKIAAEAKTPVWYQVFPEADISSLRNRIHQAVSAGCRAVCLTVGTPYRNVTAADASDPARLASFPNPALNWNAIDQMRQGLGVPCILKGIMGREEAEMAVKRGIDGIVVSNYGGLLARGQASAIEMLPSVTETVRGRIPVLVDGGFRRGSDILKALAFGAQAVLLGRPPLWGLAAYGADGVQAVLEIFQNELGRAMCQCGKVNLKAVDHSVVKVHQA